MTFKVEPGEARDSSVRREGEADEDGSLISAQTSSVTSSLSLELNLLTHTVACL